MVNAYGLVMLNDHGNTIAQNFVNEYHHTTQYATICFHAFHYFIFKNVFRRVGL